MSVPPIKEQIRQSNEHIQEALQAWAQHDYAENTESMDFIAEVFIVDLIHYCDEKKFNFSSLVSDALDHYRSEIQAREYQRQREDFYSMFQVGDRIQIEKGQGRIVKARILEVEFSNSTYIAKVWNEDKNKEDVFVWHIYQDEISVRKIHQV